MKGGHVGAFAPTRICNQMFSSHETGTASRTLIQIQISRTLISLLCWYQPKRIAKTVIRYGFYSKIFNFI